MPSSLSRTRPASQLASLSPHSSLCPASRPSKRAAHKRRSSEFRLLVNYDPYVPTKRFAPWMSSYRQGVACTSAPFPLPLPFAPHLLPLPRLELCTALEVAVKLPTATVLPLCASPGASSRPYFSLASRIASLRPAPNKPAVPAAACSASNSSLRATASSRPIPRCSWAHGRPPLPLSQPRRQHCSQRCNTCATEALPSACSTPEPR